MTRVSQIPKNPPKQTYLNTLWFIHLKKNPEYSINKDTGTWFGMGDRVMPSCVLDHGYKCFSLHFRVSIIVAIISERFLSTLIWMKFSGADGGSRVSNWDCNNSGDIKCPFLLSKRPEMTSNDPVRWTTRSFTSASFSSFPDSSHFRRAPSFPCIKMSLYTFFRAEQARITCCPEATSLLKKKCVWGRC